VTTGGPPPEGPEGPDAWQRDDRQPDTAQPGTAQPDARRSPRVYGAPVPPELAPSPRGARRRARRARARLRLVVLVVLAVLVLVLVAAYLWVHSEADPSGPPGAQVIVTVTPGSGVNQLASALEAKGVIGSSLAYRIWGQIHSAPAVLSGSYAFHQNTSFATVDRVIAAGPDVFPVEVPAGFTVSEVAERVGQLPGRDASAFESLATSGQVRSPWEPAGTTNLDGVLGTGTYIVVPGETDAQLLTAMVDRFNSLADQVDLTTRSAALGLTPYQAITLASIVQKEGYIVKNMGPVARVILNRLADDMPLQMDSTVLYALGRDGGTVTAQDLAVQSPYNTYLNKGLTPTPICFPSPVALRTALDPPAGSWLYFVVVKSDGTEAFADTFAEQQANEALAAQRGLP
jgi:UPF0755 protein